MLAGAGILAFAGCDGDTTPVTTSCLTAMDCGLGEFCVMGVCATPQATCSAAEPCTGGFTCLSGSCRPTTCFLPTDCGSTAICHEGRCRTPCVTDGECGLGQVCTAAGTCADPAICDPPCGSRQYCEEATKTCKDRGCVADEDCVATQICEGTECVDGCRSDDSCGANSICEGAACVAGCRDDSGCTDSELCRGGQCVFGCDADGDCGLGEICIAEVCEPGCMEDAGCGPGQVCEGAHDWIAGQCVAAPCHDDPYEPNDSLAEAESIDVATAVEATSCPSSEDWFIFVAEPGCVASVFVASPSEDLSLDLATADGPLGITPGRDDAGLSTEFTVGPGGPPAVVVSNLGEEEVTYTLTVATLCRADLTCPANDRFEDNDTSSMATPIEPGEALSGIICEDDVDFYELDTPAGCTLRADLAFDHTEADLSLTVLDADDQELDVSAGTTDTESVETLIEVTGSTRIRIDRVAVGSGAYTLTSQLDCAGVLTCPGNDSYEPNDSVAGAREVGSDLSVEGIVCSDDRDCFEIAPTASCLVGADLTFDASDGDLDLVLFDSSERVVDESDGEGDLESVSGLFDATWPAIVCVERSGVGVTPYELEAHSECAGCPAGDSNEPNDTFAEATELVLGRLYLGVECTTGSSDYFHFVAPGDCEIRATTISDYEYDIELYGVGSPYQRLDENTDIGGDSILIHPAQGGHDYWFRLWPTGLDIVDWTYTFEVTCG